MGREGIAVTAYAYIQWQDVPQTLVASCLRHVEDATGANLVAFDGCPLSGRMDETGEGILQVEFPFPRNMDLRHSLVDWLMHWGICFTVVM